ncbi:MAG: HigA family addiction module antitoxin [Campylobacterales bacterium]|nr:HigA family addiction module antitoxin [Campylobacterales bacterium]
MFELKRDPIHPGEILNEEFLKPLEISQTKLAKELYVSFRAINEIVNEKRGVTPEMALRLSKYFKTTPQLWLNLQNNFDLQKVSDKKSDLLKDISPCKDIAA